jgi:hypothetical protein
MKMTPRKRKALIAVGVLDCSKTATEDIGEKTQ